MFIHVYTVLHKRQVALIPTMRIPIRLLILMHLLLIHGYAQAAPHATDPFERMNRHIYTFNRKLDAAIIKPATNAYVEIVPQPARIGVRNFFSNINDIFIGLNNALQGKGKAAFSDLARVTINSTVGILGLFDAASQGGFVKHNADFGQTLAKLGIETGPYLMLPVLGPTTVRDSVNIVSEVYLYDWIAPHDTMRNGVLMLRALDVRAQLLGVDAVLEGALDPYEYAREAYFEYRHGVVTDGDPLVKNANDAEEFDPGPSER